MANKKKARKSGKVKRQMKPSDQQLKVNKLKAEKKALEAAKKEGPRFVDRAPTGLFFSYNEQLGPPYHVIIDTNFINFSIRNKLDIIKSLMDCLYAKCIPVILDSVMAEIEKLGERYKVALRIAKDKRFLRMPGYLEKGTYADDDIVAMVKQHRCFIVATCDKDLRRRLRKIPGVPMIYISARKYKVERMPEAFGSK